MNGSLSPIRICGVTDDFIVLEKPPHWLSHPSKPSHTQSVWHELATVFGQPPPALINRLDRETSGLMLAARNREAASIFGKKMMRHEIRKEYVAVVWGICLRDHFFIDRPIDREQLYRDDTKIYLKQMTLDEDEAARAAARNYKGIRPDALTEVWTQKRFRGFSLLRLRLHTGRMHQIRVHLAHVGHPVVGDKIYGPDENLYLEFIQTGWTERLREQLLLERHALHAKHLSFTWKDKTCAYEAEIPQDMRDFLVAIGG